MSDPLSGSPETTEALTRKPNVPRPEGAAPLAIKPPPVPVNQQMVEEAVKPMPAVNPTLPPGPPKVGEAAPLKRVGVLKFPHPITGEPVDLLVLCKQVFTAKEESEKIIARAQCRVEEMVTAAEKRIDALSELVEKRSQAFGGIVTDRTDKLKTELVNLVDSKNLQFSNSMAQNVAKLISAADRADKATAVIRQSDNKFNIMDDQIRSIREELKGAPKTMDERIALVRKDFGTAMEALDKKKLDRKKG